MVCHEPFSNSDPAICFQDKRQATFSLLLHDLLGHMSKSMVVMHSRYTSHAPIYCRRTRRSPGCSSSAAFLTRYAKEALFAGRSLVLHQRLVPPTASPAIRTSIAIGRNGSSSIASCAGLAKETHLGWRSNVFHGGVMSPASGATTETSLTRRVGQSRLHWNVKAEGIQVNWCRFYAAHFIVSGIRSGVRSIGELVRSESSKAQIFVHPNMHVLRLCRGLASLILDLPCPGLCRGCRPLNDEGLLDHARFQ